MPKCRLECLALALAALSLEAPIAGATNYPIHLAPPRNPQVQVNGTGLLGYLVSQGELIDPARDQVVGELFFSSTSNNNTYTIQVELGQRQDSTVIGLYNGHDAAPALMEIFPTQARLGWFAVFSYRNAPTRGVMSVFDENAALRATRTYFGADRNAIGIYASGPQGTWFSQDDRNGGKARALFYKGTGINAGCAWIAMETGASGAADDDFDDDVLFLEPVSALVEVTPIHHVRWGELKARFR